MCVCVRACMHSNTEGVRTFICNICRGPAHGHTFENCSIRRERKRREKEERERERVFLFRLFLSVGGSRGRAVHVSCSPIVFSSSSYKHVGHLRLLFLFAFCRSHASSPRSFLPRAALLGAMGISSSVEVVLEAVAQLFAPVPPPKSTAPPLLWTQPLSNTVLGCHVRYLEGWLLHTNAALDETNAALDVAYRRLSRLEVEIEKLNRRLDES